MQINVLFGMLKYFTLLLILYTCFSALDSKASNLSLLSQKYKKDA